MPAGSHTAGAEPADRADPAADALERRVEGLWLAAEGLAAAPPELALHPEDEMYGWLATVGVPRACRRAVYLRGGAQALAVLAHVAALRGRPLAEVGSVLDFACGYGRGTRFLAAALGPGRVWAADVLPGAVRFVAEALGARAFRSTTDPAALEAPRRFELVWAGSLFSHLPRPRFEAWLARLLALVEPGGALVLSTHGAAVEPDLPRDASGFTFVRRSESRTLALDEYGAAYVAPALVERLARAAGAASARVAVRDVWGTQDVAVVTPGAPGGLAAWRGTPRVHGAIEVAELDGGGAARVGGWVQSPAWAGPPRDVRVVLEDGRSEPAALLGAPRRLSAEEGGGGRRPDAGALPDGEGLLHQEWGIAGPLGAAGDAVPVVAATARAGAGPPACFDARPLVRG